MKLSGRDMYGLWETQMLCLLESHDMLGFINGEFVSPDHDYGEGKKKKKKVGDNKAWRRSDAFVKGWILGSLSEQTLSYVLNRLRPQSNPAYFTAKDVWNILHCHYDHLPFQQPAGTISSLLVFDF